MRSVMSLELRVRAALPLSFTRLDSLLSTIVVPEHPRAVCCAVDIAPVEIAARAFQQADNIKHCRYLTIPETNREAFQVDPDETGATSDLVTAMASLCGAFSGLHIGKQVC